MAAFEAVLKEIVDRVFPEIQLPFETHWQEIQKHELNRKNLGLLLHLGLQSQQNEVQENLVRDFHEALFPKVGLPSQ